MEPEEYLFVHSPSSMVGSLKIPGTDEEGGFSSSRLPVGGGYLIQASDGCVRGVWRALRGCGGRMSGAGVGRWPKGEMVT